MKLIYHVRYRDTSKKTGETFKAFSGREDIILWAQESNVHILSAKPDYLKTAGYYLSLLVKPTAGYGELSDRELIQLLKLLRNMNKYRKHEKKQLQIFENYAKNDKRYKNLKKVLEKLASAMTRGIPVYVALDMVGVPKYVTKAIRVGEKTAGNVVVYDKLIEVLETKYETARKIKRLLNYPKIVFFVLYGYFLMTIYYQIPQTRKIMNMLDPSKFPDITKKFYAMSDYAIAHPIGFFLISLATILVVYKILYFVISRLTRYIPYVRNVYLARDYTLLTALLSVSTAASIMITEAIAMSAEVMSLKKLKEKFLTVATEIAERGVRFSTALKEEGFDKMDSFSRDFYNMVFAMEDTGELHLGFEDLYKDYKASMEDVIETSKEFLQPVLLFVIVVFVVIIFYAVNAPLNTMGSNPFGG